MSRSNSLVKRKKYLIFIINIINLNQINYIINIIILSTLLFYLMDCYNCFAVCSKSTIVSPPQEGLKSLLSPAGEKNIVLNKVNDGNSVSKINLM